MSDSAESRQPGLKDRYDYIIAGVGAFGAVIAGELFRTDAGILAIESGGVDDAPTISNPSIWFYNVGSPLDWALPIAPKPQPNKYASETAPACQRSSPRQQTLLVHDWRPRRRSDPCGYSLKE